MGLEAVERAVTHWQIRAPAAWGGDLIEYLREGGLASVALLHEFAESPIELEIAPWLVFMRAVPLRAFYYGDPSITAANPTGGFPIVIVPQREFNAAARYRADFALTDERGRVVVIECDGADYHDPDEDKVRDDALALLGVTTVRASGTEIYKAPLGVVGRVQRALEGAAS